MNGKALVVEDGEVVAPGRIVEDAVFESVLGIMTELEYTGHSVTDTARLQILVAKAGEPLLGLLSDVRRMAVLAQHMLQQGLVAFERQELGLARAVRGDDSEVDALCRLFYHEVLTFIESKITYGD